MTADRSVRIFVSAEELAAGVAHHILTTIADILADRSRAIVVLAGGETPRRVYQILPDHPLTQTIDWSCVHLLFSDERVVPPQSAESNYGMVRNAMLRRLGIPEANVHRVHGELTPAEAADRYEAEIHDLFRSREVRPDLTLLGIGEDGHTASLFPGTGAEEIADRIAIAVHLRDSNRWRVSLSLPALNASREIVLLASGKGKASILHRLLSASENEQFLPAALLRPWDGHVTMMIDSDAASKLLQ